MNKARVGCQVWPPGYDWCARGANWKDHTLHVLRNLEMVARLQVQRPSMTVQQLAAAVLADIERIRGRDTAT